MPHLPGNDVKSCLHVERTAKIVHAFVWALILWSRGQAGREGLPDPATQTDADMASATISSTDVMEARRMDRETFQRLKGYRNSKLQVRIL